MTKNTQKIELTQKQLNERLGEARLDGYNLGKKHSLYPRNHKQAVALSNLVDALTDIFDERYEPIKEDY